MVYQETFVQRDLHRIYVRDHPGTEPTIVVMHGFPDNLHLYDRRFCPRVVSNVDPVLVPRHKSLLVDHRSLRKETQRPLRKNVDD